MIWLCLSEEEMAMWFLVLCNEIDNPVFYKDEENRKKLKELQEKLLFIKAHEK